MKILCGILAALLVSGIPVMSATASCDGKVYLHNSLSGEGKYPIVTMHQTGGQRVVCGPSHEYYYTDIGKTSLYSMDNPICATGGEINISLYTSDKDSHFNSALNYHTSIEKNCSKEVCLTVTGNSSDKDSLKLTATSGNCS